MSEKKKPSRIITIPVLELITALGIVLFWIYFFAVENSNPKNTSIYLAYERAFPLADIGWLSLALVIGAIGLLRMKKYGILFSLVGGGAMIFLGLLDMSFNTLQGNYTKSVADGIMNGFINLWSLLFGIFLIIYVWRKRQLIQ